MKDLVSLVGWPTADILPT